MVGKARSCTTDQRSAYTSRALQVYGDVVLNWPPAIVADMGHLIGKGHQTGDNSLVRDMTLVTPHQLEGNTSEIYLVKADTGNSKGETLVAPIW